MDGQEHESLLKKKKKKACAEVSDLCGFMGYLYEYNLFILIEKLLKFNYARNKWKEKE